MSDPLRPHGLYNPWKSAVRNTGVGSLTLLQRILLTQGSNPGLPHCRWSLYQLSHKGSPVRLLVRLLAASKTISEPSAPFRTAAATAPITTAKHCWPTPLPETLKTLTGKSCSISCGVAAPFPWVLVCTRFCLCPPTVSVSLSPVEVLLSSPTVFPN